jgi:hypothetical protein
MGVRALRRAPGKKRKEAILDIHLTLALKSGHLVQNISSHTEAGVTARRISILSRS